MGVIHYVSVEVLAAPNFELDGSFKPAGVVPSAVKQTGAFSRISSQISALVHH